MRYAFALTLAALSAIEAVLWISETQDDPAAADIRRFHALEPLAENGDTGAQFGLVGLYREGKCAGVDPRVAAQWTPKAAKKWVT